MHRLKFSERSKFRLGQRPERISQDLEWPPHALANTSAAGSILWRPSRPWSSGGGSASRGWCCIPLKPRMCSCSDCTTSRVCPWSAKRSQALPLTQTLDSSTAIVISSLEARTHAQTRTRACTRRLFARSPGRATSSVGRTLTASSRSRRARMHSK